MGGVTNPNDLFQESSELIQKLEENYGVSKIQNLI
jgi:hypothetical protein